MGSEASEPPELKEGIVLDQEGNTLFVPQEQQDPFSGPGGAGFRVIRFGGGGWFVVALLAVGLPLLFVAGLTFFAALIAALIIFRVIRAVVRMARGA